MKGYIKLEITDYYLTRKCYLTEVSMKTLEGGIFVSLF